jgi:hypothetical protein
MKSVKHGKKRRQYRTKKMRGGDPPIPISYEQVDEMVKAAFARIQSAGAVATEAVVAGLVAEAIGIMLNSPSTGAATGHAAEALYSAAATIGSLFQFTLSTLELTAEVSTSVTGTVLSGIARTASTALSGLTTAVGAAIRACSQFPAVSGAAIGATTTAIVLQTPAIRDATMFTIDNGLRNTITYMLFDLMIRSGRFVDVRWQIPNALPDAPAVAAAAAAVGPDPQQDPNELNNVADELAGIAETASRTASPASSRASSQSVSSQSTQDEYEYLYRNVPENMAFANAVTDQMFEQVRLLTQRLQERSGELANLVEADADSSQVRAASICSSSSSSRGAVRASSFNRNSRVFQEPYPSSYYGAPLSRSYSNSSRASINIPSAAFNVPSGYGTETGSTESDEGADESKGGTRRKRKYRRNKKKKTKRRSPFRKGRAKH